MLVKFIHGVDSVNEWVGKIFSWFILPISLITFLEVIVRYFFNSPTNWASESTGYLFGIMSFMSGGYCLRHRLHIRMELVIGKISQKSGAILEIITSIFTYLFLCVLIWKGSIYAWEAMMALETSGTVWNPPYWPFTWFLPIGAFLLLLQELTDSIKNIYCIVNKELPQ